jgi:hypothetical protein
MLGGRTGTKLRRFADPGRLALVFVAALALLLADNVYWLVRNQMQLDCAYKVCVSPRSIEAVMLRSPNPKISFLANLHFLSRRIPGAKVTVPRWLAAQRWYLEHLGRLRVEIADSPLTIDAAQVDRLRAASADRSELRWWHNRAVRSYLYLRQGADAGDYVMAETAKARGPVFVMPRSEYATLTPR